MNILIRTDSSFQIGTGHVMRCLTLAEENDASILFVCRDLPGDLLFLVKDKGYRLSLLPYDESHQETLEELSKY